MLLVFECVPWLTDGVEIRMEFLGSRDRVFGLGWEIMRFYEQSSAYAGDNLLVAF